MSFLPLSEKIVAMRNPSVIGLDPMPDYVPAGLLAEYPDVCDAIFAFNRGIIDAAADIAPAVKPQAAFYERLGLPGYICLLKTIAYAASAGMFVILDAKRGDIGSTAKAYADAYLSPRQPLPEKKPDIDISSALSYVDSLTVNGYLGSDGVLPFLDAAKASDKAVFVLAKTSNPSSGELQDRDIMGRPLYRLMGEMIDGWGADSIGSDGYSACGAVIGATYPRQLADMRKALPHTFFLIPGYGAQGGGASDAAPGFDEKGGGAVVNSSRGIMLSYRKKPELDWKDAVREAVIAMRDDLRAALA